MSTGVYAPDKALAFPDRLQAIRDGRQPYPVHLHLIISDLCNLNCGGCAYRLSGYTSNQLFNEVDASGASNHNPNRMLSRELVRSVLEDCVAMGTQAVEFTGGGEPTIHPDAPELLTYAQELGLDTALITNAIQLPRMGDAAVMTKWLRISLDAATPETFAKVRPTLGGGNAQTFEKVLTNVKSAVMRRGALGTDCMIGLGFVVQKENWHELLDFVKLAYMLGVDNVRISGLFTPEGDAYHDEHREAAMALEQEAVAEFDDSYFKVHGRFAEKVADLQAPPDYSTCHYQQLTTYMGGDGSLYRCCVTSYNRLGMIGNVTAAGGLKALWDSAGKQARISNFNARACAYCQFTDRNKAIQAAVEADELPSSQEDVLHATFV